MIVLGRSLHKRNPKLLRYLFTLLLGHLSLFVEIPLSPHNNNISSLTPIIFNLLHPTSYMLETFHICYWVYQDYTICAFVKCFCYVPETLLPSCVPNVESHLFGIDLYFLNFEIHSDCAEELGVEFLLAVTH